MPAEWSDAELDLLSAYIDEQLDDSERTALEARLAQDADLRQELAAMRQTVALLRDLPTIRAPRAFTLTPEMVGQKAVPMLTMVPAAAVQEKRQRPTRRVWWIPAASAAGVVLLAGVFAVTQMSSPTSGAPAPGAVAMGPTSTPTQVQDFTTLNTVIDARTSVAIGAASEAIATGTSTPTTTSIPTSTPPSTFSPELARTDAKIEVTEVGPEPEEVEDQADTEVNVIPAPPIQAALPTMLPSPQPQPNDDIQQQASSEATTNVEFAPRQSASPEPDTADGAPQANSIVLPTATLDIMSLPSGGGAFTTATPDQMYDVVPQNSPGPGIEAVAGMDGINPDPNASGFTVSTASPIQGTVIAQYQVSPDQSIYAANTTTGGVLTTSTAVPVAQESPSRPPIWIRWINTLSNWLTMLFEQN